MEIYVHLAVSLMLLLRQLDQVSHQQVLIKSFESWMVIHKNKCWKCLMKISRDLKTAVVDKMFEMKFCPYRRHRAGTIISLLESRLGFAFALQQII